MREVSCSRCPFFFFFFFQKPSIDKEAFVYFLFFNESKIAFNIPICFLTLKFLVE